MTLSLYDDLLNGPLSSEIREHIVSGNDGDIVKILNRKDIIVPGLLSSHNVKKYISLLGLRILILDNASNACRSFNLALEDFNDCGFDLSDPVISKKITAILDEIIAEGLVPGFTEAVKNTILSFGNKTISRADQLGLNINLDVIAAALRG